MPPKGAHVRDWNLEFHPFKVSILMSDEIPSSLFFAYCFSVSLLSLSSHPMSEFGV